MQQFWKQESRLLWPSSEGWHISGVVVVERFHAAPDWLPLRYLTLESFINPGGEETMEQKLATNRSLALDTRTRHRIIWALTLKVFLCSR
jgi:hypothetical protein